MWGYVNEGELWIENNGVEGCIRGLSLKRKNRVLWG